MFHEPKTKEEAQKYRYGAWGGNPKGYAYDQTKCAAEVANGWHYYQCSRKNGSGPDGLYCKTHAKMLKTANAELTGAAPTKHGEHDER